MVIIRLVNLLQIALPITGQRVTDNESIKLSMLSNQILRLKIGLWWWKNGPKEGSIAIGASKSAKGGVRGTIQAQKKLHCPPLDTMQASWDGLNPLSTSVQYLIGGK